MKETYLFGLKTTLLLVCVSMLILSCGTHRPDINVTCDITKDKSYVIKWEIYPKINGVAKIYISKDPNNFDTKKPPIAITDIDSNYIKIASPDSLSRFYFMISFDDKFKQIVGTRGIKMESVYAFRDIGGYNAAGDKYVKWGMIYRSGIIDTINEQDKKLFKKLGIKTIINFRSNNEQIVVPEDLGVNTIVKLPMTNYNDSLLKERIYRGDLNINDARVFMQDFFVSLLDTKTQEEYALMFNILTQEDNYPIVISSNFGKGYCDFASALILSVFDVSQDCIFEDYTWANQYFSSKHLKRNLNRMPPDVYESILTMLHNDRNDMLRTLNTINDKFGSVQNFLSKNIRISNQKKAKLETILLAKEQ